MTGNTSGDAPDFDISNAGRQKHFNKEEDKMKKTLFITISVVFASLLFAFSSAFTARAGEHPSEHPAEKPAAKQEHPAEHPHEAKSKVTKDSLEKAIKDYVKTDSVLKGGYFLVYDKVDKKPLVLTLQKVHKDRLSKVSNGVYFFCADFKTPDGLVYDLDIFMKDGAHGLETTEVVVHKKNGKARYGWVEKDGIWSRKENK